MTDPLIIPRLAVANSSGHMVGLGIEAQVAGDMAGAEKHYRAALRLDPKHVVGNMNLAILYSKQERIQDALDFIERAAAVRSDHPAILLNRALICLKAGRLRDALEYAHRANDSQPGPDSWMALGLVCTAAGFPEEAVGHYNRVMDVLAPEAENYCDVGLNASFAQSLTSAGPAEMLRQRQRWYDANRYRGPKYVHENDRDPNRPLRVGYVGGDFRTHSASRIFSHVLLNHTEAIETYLYSNNDPDPGDPVGEEFRALAGPRWRDIRSLDDEACDRLIRSDRIDILVDLAAQSQHNRLRLFTRKPAPVQVTAWGFVLGTGCPEIDWFFADPVVIPPDERQFFAEKIYDLPCVMTMRFPAELAEKVPASTPAPVERNGWFTFGCHSRYEKLSAACLEAFGEILRRVPNSVLELKDTAFQLPYAKMRAFLAMPGIEEERVRFFPKTSHLKHVRAMQRVDLCLDSFPHVGGAVALEQIWAGVPLLTLRGANTAGRLSASLLSAIGRQEWIAEIPEDFVERAVKLAENPASLAEWRQTLRRDLLSSPVINGYAAAVERAYREIWRQWCRSQ